MNVSFCEKCKKTEYQDKVALKRCGRCKNVFYCSPECQKGDWRDHSYYCRKPDAVIRKENEKGGFMGLKNSVNVPVDVDPVTGDFNAQPLIDRIKADQAKIGKEKVSAPPVPKTWQYTPPETEKEREEKMQAYEKKLDMTKFGEKELKGWKYLLSSDEKDYIWALWQLFSEGDERLPLTRVNTRCARELIKLAGGRPTFEWLAKRGNSWVGVEQKDRSRDSEIGDWIREVTKKELDEEFKDTFDCTLLTRFFCVRRACYEDEK